MKEETTFIVNDIITLAVPVPFGPEGEGRCIDTLTYDSNPTQWYRHSHDCPIHSVDKSTHTKHTQAILILEHQSSPAFLFCQASATAPIYVSRQLDVFTFRPENESRNSPERMLLYLHRRKSIDQSCASFLVSRLYSEISLDKFDKDELLTSELPDDFFSESYFKQYQDYYVMYARNERFLPAGSSLMNGKYVVDKVLGTGGFGIVYLGHLAETGATVAIKELFVEAIHYRDSQFNVQAETLEQQEFYVHAVREKFLGEIRKIQKCHHSNIISVHEDFEDHHTHYYVMEYIQGESLESRLQHYGTYSVTSAIRTLLPIARALNYMHQHLTLHLDVKLDNILIQHQSDNPVLIDFGAAKEYFENRMPRSANPLMCSLNYACQDIYHHLEENTYNNLDFLPKTDIYSLGVCLFRLITGNFPPAKIQRNAAFRSLLPPNLQTIIKKALTLRTHYSYFYMSDFIDDLEYYLHTVSLY